jgi:hypothetical protein
MPADISALVTNTAGVPGGLVDISQLVTNTNDVPQAAGNLATIQGMVASLAIDVSDLQAKVAALVSESQPSGVVGLYDVRSDLGSMTTFLELIRNHTLDTKGAMDVLVNDGPNPDRTNLYDLLQQLICTCQQLQQVVAINTSILANLPGPSTIIYMGDASNSTAQPDHCQRVRWLIDAIYSYVTIPELDIDNPGPGGVGGQTASSVQAAYQRWVGVEVPTSRAQEIAQATTMIYRGMTFPGGLSMLQTLYNDNRDAMICALYEGSNPSAAMAAWKSHWDTYSSELAGPGLLRLLVWPDMLNQLYDGHIPLDDAHSSYSNDCSNCNGGGVGQRSVCLDHEIVLPWPDIRIDLEGRRFYLMNFFSFVNDFSNGVETCPLGAANSAGVIFDGIVGNELVYVLGNFTGYQIRVTTQQGDVNGVNANVRWCNDPQSAADLGDGTELPDGGAWATVGQTSHFCICQEWDPNSFAPGGGAPAIHLKPPS